VVGKSRGVLAGLVAISAAMSPAHATTPDPSWRGVERLYILAHLTGPIEAALPSEGFCERVRRIAAEGAPFPVQCTTFDEAPSAEAGGHALVVIQGAVQPLPGDRLLIVAARRTTAAGLEPAPIYLGATPRAVRLSGAAAGEAADAALRETLAEILPWLGHDG
jgi:hypothetical protein